MKPNKIEKEYETWVEIIGVIEARKAIFGSLHAH